MSKVLVLGSEGQIGKPLVSYLRKRGHSVVGWDKVISVREDLANYSNLEKLIEDCTYADKVIFLAFEVGGSKFLSEMDKEFSYVNENVTLMRNTFLALRHSNTPFLFSSSQMSQMHNTNYGFLKDLGERYCKTMKNSWVCKFWNVYGEEDPESVKSHVITDFIDQAKREKKISCKTTGEERRQFLHVDDCCEALSLWVEDEWSQNYCYDITSFTWNSIKEVAEIIANKTDSTVEFQTKTDSIQLGREISPTGYALKYWSPKITLEEGIERLL